jgi:hypothetical protein
VKLLDAISAIFRAANRKTFPVKNIFSDVGARIATRTKGFCPTPKAAETTAKTGTRNFFSIF